MARNAKKQETVYKQETINKRLSSSSQTKYEGEQLGDTFAKTVKCLGLGGRGVSDVLFLLWGKVKFFMERSTRARRIGE